MKRSPGFGEPNGYGRAALSPLALARRSAKPSDAGSIAVDDINASNDE
jgi:hypothetical protein